MTIAWAGVSVSFNEQDDTPNSKVNDHLLMKEWNAVLPEGKKALWGPSGEEQGEAGSGIMVYTWNFEAELSAAEKITVAGIIAAHDGESSTKTPIKIQKNAEEVNATTTWEARLQRELPPLQKGAWQADISLALKKGSDAIASKALARIMARKNGGSWSDVAPFVLADEEYDTKSVRIPFVADESDVWELGVQWKRSGDSDDAYIKNVRISVVYEGINFYVEE